MLTAVLFILLSPLGSYGSLGVGILVGLAALESRTLLGRRLDVAPVRVARLGMWAGFSISALGGLLQVLWLAALGAGVMIVCLIEGQFLYRTVRDGPGKRA